jgi:hypothetical protein
LTSSQFRAHFFRQVIVRPHTAQVFVGMDVRLLGATISGGGESGSGPPAELHLRRCATPGRPSNPWEKRTTGRSRRSARGGLARTGALSVSRARAKLSAAVFRHSPGRTPRTSRDGGRQQPPCPPGGRCHRR